MNRIEELFQQHDVRLKKIASVFTNKSHGTIERQEFYQEFAVRLIELYRRYETKPDKEFTKILNFSLHNLACDMLRARFTYFCVEDIDVAVASGVDRSVYRETLAPSFLYFYKESAQRLIQDARTRKIFVWLMEHPEVVEEIRREKNLSSIRTIRLALSDVIQAVAKNFEIKPCLVRYHIKVIKDSLKQAWQLEYGLAKI
jgi:hypothetical protein